MTPNFWHFIGWRNNTKTMQCINPRHNVTNSVKGWHKEIITRCIQKCNTPSTDLVTLYTTV